VPAGFGLTLGAVGLARNAPRRKRDVKGKPVKLGMPPNAQGHVTRQAAHIRRLEQRLSELLGDAAWHEAGIGAPADVDALQQRITHLEQQVVDLQGTIAERDQELDAARAASREFITNLNRRPR
jgi:hypothetical protein